MASSILLLQILLGMYYCPDEVLPYILDKSPVSNIYIVFLLFEFDQIISPKALLCVLFKFLLIQAQAVTSTLLRKAQRLS